MTTNGEALFLGLVLGDERSELSDDGVDQLLPVPVRLPELSEHGAPPPALSHPRGGGRGERGEGGGEGEEGGRERGGGGEGGGE